MDFRHSLILATLLTTSAIAAEPSTSPAPNPAMQALGQMVEQCSAREATITTQAFAMRAQIDALTAKLAQANKRADDAEAKLPKADTTK